MGEEEWEWGDGGGGLDAVGRVGRWRYAAWRVVRSGRRIGNERADEKTNE